jgi:hypothetical protein
MPDEPPNLVENLVQISITEHGAKTLDEQTECYNSTAAQVNVERCRRADEAATAGMVRQVDDEAADRQDAQVRELADRLPADHTAWYGLRDLSMGIKYLIEQVKILQETLANHGYLEPGERHHMIRLSGKDPMHIFTQRWVFQVDCDCLAAVHGAGKLTAGQAAQALACDRPEGVGPEEYARRLGPLVAGMVDHAQAREYLRENLESMETELLDRLELIRRREADARAQARVDISAEGEKRSRYINRDLRLRYAALRELRALKKDQRENGGEAVADDDLPATFGGAPEQVPETVPQAAEIAGESKANWPPAEADPAPDGTTQTTSSSPVVSAGENGASQPSGAPQTCGESLEGAAGGVPPDPTRAAAAGA